MLFDALVAVGCLMALAMFAEVPDDRPPGLSALALLSVCVLLSLATVVRRRWPTVLGLAAAAGVPLYGFQPLLVVCLYSWARCSRSRRGLAVLCGAVVVVRAVVFAALNQPALTVGAVFLHLVSEVPFVVGPVLLGVYMRSRRRCQVEWVSRVPSGSGCVWLVVVPGDGGQ
ncbi:hypothetical protein ACFXPT_35890 [Streptomyces goshikiensis]|uniref:hypothetical protein n=1 Tax=Streptomyces goshikiensis TaxID=1942 RepID=UPI00368EE26C